MKTPKIYRQGDVMFIPCDNIPQGTKRANGSVAYGEVTGHSHKLADLVTADVFECGDGLYVRVSEDGISIDGQPGCSFVHEEHGPINLPPGSYKVAIQREYSPEHPWIIRDVID